MTKKPTPIPASTIVALKWAFVGAIIVQTIVAFILAPVLEPTIEGDMRYLLGGLFLLVGISSFFLTRFVVLPAMAKQPEVQPATIAAPAFGFAETPAIYGLVLAIMTGEGWVALPFSGVALAGMFVMSGYVASLESARPEDFARL